MGGQHCCYFYHPNTHNILWCLCVGDTLFLKPHWRGADLGGERLTINWEFWESYPRNAGFFPRCDCLVNFRIWQPVKPNSSRHKSQQGPEQSASWPHASKGHVYSFPLSVKADSLTQESIWTIFPFLSCLCVHVRVHVICMLCAHVYVCGCVQRHVDSLLYHSLPYFLRQGLSPNLELTD